MRLISNLLNILALMTTIRPQRQSKTRVEPLGALAASAFGYGPLLLKGGLFGAREVAV